MEIIPADEKNSLMNSTGVNMQDNLGIEQNTRITCVDLGVSDEEYGDFSSDSSWKHNLHSDSEDKVVPERVSNDDCEDSDTNFSEFEDNEADIVVLDSESEEEDDLMRQVMR